MNRVKIACVIPPYYKIIASKNNRLTPAMHNLAGFLHQRGYDVTYINGDFAGDTVYYADRISLINNNWMLSEQYFPLHPSFNDVISLLQNIQPDIVVISAGDVLIPTVEIGNNHICAYLSKRIKNDIGKHVRCIGYGHLLKYMNKSYLKYFDAYITCEAETIIEQIIDKNLKGGFHDVWTNDLDKLPILIKDYIYDNVKPQDWDYIMSMRGCPSRCSFCFQPSMRNGRLSFVSPKRFLEEIQYRLFTIGTSDFYFSDMIFLPEYGNRASEMLYLLRELKQQENSFNWWAEARADFFNDKPKLISMKEAGCSNLKFGVEMGNQLMLDRMGKNITLESIVRSFQLAAEVGIKRTAYILLGCPGFTDQDYSNMWNFFSELKADNYVLNINVPYKGTKLYYEIENELHKANLYLNGEEGFIHLSSAMKEFWGISNNTLNLFLSLQTKKEDSKIRDYQRLIIDKKYFKSHNVIRFI